MLEDSVTRMWRHRDSQTRAGRAPAFLGGGGGGEEKKKKERKENLIVLMNAVGQPKCA